MPRMTHAEWLAYEARRNKIAVNSDGVDKESDLHDEVISFCRTKGWLCFHSRMDKRPTNAVGTPDFILARSDGSTIYVECKRRGAKCSPAQNAMLAWLRQNGQKAFVVSSMTEFLSICDT